jgi:nucleoside-diphosphate-sugar epimerase
MRKMEKILITGSSGFIGSNLVKNLINKSFLIFGIDKIEPNFSHQCYRFINCDILNGEKLAKTILEVEPDIVIHLAARIDLDEKKNLSGYNANIQGVRNLIEAISQCSSVKRCIYTSSQLVCRVGYVPSYDEDYQPNTLYGQSKVLTERIVRELDGGSVEWCLVRPTTVWGPGMSEHYQKFIRMIEKGRYFHVGNRPLYKSFSYIGNIVHQYYCLMGAPIEQIHGQTFYLADYEPFTLRDWTNALQRELGAKPIPTYPVFLVKLVARLGDALNLLGLKSFPFNSFRLNNVLTEYVFDLSKTEKVCGALPYSFDEAVSETIRWIREMPKVLQTPRKNRKYRLNVKS